MTALVDRAALWAYMARVYDHMEADMLAADNAAYLRGYRSAMATVAAAVPVKPPSPDADLLDLAKLVYGSFGGGLVVTFSEQDVAEFAAAIAKAEAAA